MKPGAKIGHYSIVAKIGAGGMGEVYRATDTKLNREVALKVLPDEFARDKDRMARFRREAQVLASLNHPNIAAIYGLEEEDGTQALALELVEGLTLAERIAEGPLPLDDALSVARQIAEALEAAHERGVIHRDLKPANVKITEEGAVKVLDFGLAKALEETDAGEDISNSPTLSVAATRAGIILGTAAYMSPEQARGGKTDRRADVWSFGVVLYEMLTGRQAFTGETTSDILARVLERDPDWEALPDEAPRPIRRLLERCLTKDKRRRLGAISEAIFVIEEYLADPNAALASPAAPAKEEPPWLRALPWGVAALMALAVVVLAFRTPRPGDSAPSGTRLAIPIPPASTLVTAPSDALATSPDGSLLVYVVRRRGVSRLMLRPTDRFEATELAGTEGASGPFFSPDGRWVGFFAENKIKKVPVSGGTPQTVGGMAPDNRGASWSADGTIYFSPEPSPRLGLFRVPASGGTVETVTTPDPGKGEGSHRWPHMLPRGKALLYTSEKAGSASFDDAQIVLLNISTGEKRVLVEGGMHARYATSGHILYVRTGTLWALPFDLDRLEVTGPAVPVLEGVSFNPSTGVAQFAVSNQGFLAYIAGGADALKARIQWFDRKGEALSTGEEFAPYREVAVSPDGRQLALTIAAANDDIWLLDLERGTQTRLTFGEGDNGSPVWSPEGKRIAFYSSRDGVANLYSMPADGSASPQHLLESELNQFPSSWSPDGNWLAYMEAHPVTQADLWVLPMEGNQEPRPFLITDFDENVPQFSPDGKWIAYRSNESGRYEVYVQPFPGPGGKRQVSNGGGTYPKWSPAGGELFFLDLEGYIVSVPVETSPVFTTGTSRRLFRAPVVAGTWMPYAVAPGNRRFVVLTRDEESLPTQINVVLNWFEELQRLAPPGN